MASRISRLPREHIPEVVKKGKRYHGALVSLHVLPLEHADGARFAFVVSKKVARKAVLRNRIRRRMREATRGLLDRIRPGLGIVLVGKKEIRDVSLHDIAEEITQLLKKARAFTDV